MTDERLTVLQVSPADIGGGAEKVALDLHEQYLKRGIDSWLAVGRKTSTHDRVLEIPRDDSASSWKRRLLGLADSRSHGPHRARRRLGTRSRAQDRSRPRPHGPHPAGT